MENTPYLKSRSTMAFSNKRYGKSASIHKHGERINRQREYCPNINILEIDNMELNMLFLTCSKFCLTPLAVLEIQFYKNLFICETVMLVKNQVVVMKWLIKFLFKNFFERIPAQIRTGTIIVKLYLPLTQIPDL